MKSPIKFYIQDQPYLGDVSISAFTEQGEKRFVLKSDWVEVEEGHEVGPTISMGHRYRRESLQGLMDELWKFGVRPSEIGTPGHLAATQQHLSDMRKLVEKTLDVKL